MPSVQTDRAHVAVPVVPTETMPAGSGVPGASIASASAVTSVAGRSRVYRLAVPPPASTQVMPEPPWFPTARFAGRPAICVLGISGPRVPFPTASGGKCTSSASGPPAPFSGTANTSPGCSGSVTPAPVAVPSWAADAVHDSSIGRVTPLRPVVPAGEIDVRRRRFVSSERVTATPTTATAAATPLATTARVA